MRVASARRPAGRALLIVLSLIVVVATSACDPSDASTSPPPPPPPPSVPTSETTTTAAQVWTFHTRQEICPPDQWRGSTWTALPMETTVAAEAVLGTQIGACVDDNGLRTYLYNSGDTAWDLKSTGAITHLYLTDQAALFLPLRDLGRATSVLGPREVALLGAAPSQLSWEINPQMTLAAAQTSAIASHFSSTELTSKALGAVDKRAAKGTLTGALASCSSAALGIATTNWSPGDSASQTLDLISNVLGASKDSAKCLSRVSEYDEARALRTGLPRAFPRLDAEALAVTRAEVEAAQEGIDLAGHLVRALVR